MPDKLNNLPVKTREFHNHHMNSTLWNDFAFRDDDIIIATYAKSGTTWMQQIVSQLIFDGKEGINVPDLSPWVDFRLVPPERFPKLEAQTNRRFIKTHLPLDALLVWPKAKYIYIARDGRDTAWSMFNHYVNFSEERFALMSSAPGLVGPGIEKTIFDVHEFYSTWFNGNGSPYWPYWEHIRTWWACREAPNILLVHFNDLKADLAGNIRRIAAFLNIEQPDATMDRIIEHCTFDYMKTHAELVAPAGGTSWEGGARTFINKGTNNRWRDVLSAEEIAEYEARALAELGPDCARWLEFGGRL
jgi:aryl sulfotransferase